MIDEVTRINMLLDFYGNLLSTKQRRAVLMYYSEDYTINEIAYELEISKQAVSDNIRRGIDKLNVYESSLGLLNNYITNKKDRESLESLFVELKQKSKDIDEEVLKKIYAIIFK